MKSLVGWIYFSTFWRTTLKLSGACLWETRNPVEDRRAFPVRTWETHGGRIDHDTDPRRDHTAGSPCWSGCFWPLWVVCASCRWVGNQMSRWRDPISVTLP